MPPPPRRGLRASGGLQPGTSPLAASFGAADKAQTAGAMGRPGLVSQGVPWVRPILSDSLAGDADGSQQFTPSTGWRVCDAIGLANINTWELVFF